MLDVSNIDNRVSDVLRRNLEATKEDVKKSMAANNQVVTGKTANSLRVDVSGNEGILWGSEHIDTLETGISPQRSNMESFNATFLGINQWQQSRGLMWERKQVFGAVSIQKQQGSVLFRAGGRFNVYSDKVDPLVERIKDELGEIIINTKILE
jgi:hypothetical protein